MQQKEGEKREISEKEKRIRAITKIYYSNPNVQKALVEFSKDREVVPRYFEGFGKRPDSVQYPSDVMGWINRGATSLHGSEELWQDPLEIDSDMSRKEFDNLRKGWDLLIDIDSPFLDYSKIAAELIIASLEQHGIKNYGLKFSGSKGFHIIISWKAFPKEFNGELTKDKFPEWPRAISKFLMEYIREDYNRKVGETFDLEKTAERMGLKKEDLETEVICTVSNRPAKRSMMVKLICPECGLEIDRRNYKPSKRRLTCLNSDCAGVLEVVNSKEYYFCEHTKDPENEKIQMSSDKYPENFKKGKGMNAEMVASLDLVLVAPRHLFRMPYSLHEKTTLASVVLNKEDLEVFSPKDADPLKAKVREFLPENEEGEATRLLNAALDWSKDREIEEEKFEEKKYGGKKNYEDIKIEGVTEEMFPKSIKKLLKGLVEGRKRGLFVLITFLRSLNFPDDYVRQKVKEWNDKNEVPLKEGYVKSQVDWHLRQRKKILPPNYANDAFYKDIGLIDKKQEVKNPLVEVLRELRKRKS